MSCSTRCLFALGKDYTCSCGGLNHGRWDKSKDMSPGDTDSCLMEDRATLASDPSAIRILHRRSLGDPPRLGERKR
jgi:hypothetical protein